MQILKRFFDFDFCFHSLIKPYDYIFKYFYEYKFVKMGVSNEKRCNNKTSIIKIFCYTLFLNTESRSFIEF